MDDIEGKKQIRVVDGGDQDSIILLSKLFVLFSHLFTLEVGLKFILDNTLRSLG